MGCSPGDDLCAKDEKPQHKVTLAGFEILATEVTEGQYQAAMGKNPSAEVLGPAFPVENVNWAEAQAFCKTVGGRLPTEAEWEYAARGGTTTRRYCGDAPKCLAKIAWDHRDLGQHKRAVKGKAPNAYGLYDMLGNVWEWTGDWYAADYYGSAPAVGPTGPKEGVGRVRRGGAFDGDENHLRVSSRYDGDPTDAYRTLGFRCVRPLAL